MKMIPNKLQDSLTHSTLDEIIEGRYVLGNPILNRSGFFRHENFIWLEIKLADGTYKALWPINEAEAIKQWDWEFDLLDKQLPSTTQVKNLIHLKNTGIKLGRDMEYLLKLYWDKEFRRQIKKRYISSYRKILGHRVGINFS